ncbi:MAG: AGE family epimerase/isomerase [Lachnospiraceae bacterium]|nr:AGE family epimerase/isomerase [Lachnospiraceae bacterium]
MMKKEVKNHLINDIIPFWKKLRDDVHGGYYGFMDFDLKVDEKAVKGCILNSRITWFFANAYMVLKDESLLDEAKHGYEFMKNYCMDKENGGIFWSLQYDGTPEETLKHTYNQAFAIYALSSYYDASKDKEALDMAYELFELIETKCRDEYGYLEAFNEKFELIDNEKLSENGVMAEKTMNTLLHVFEAYTELYRVDKNEKVKEKLQEILDIFADKVYNPEIHRQEVFFDKYWNTIIDLHSYGHDIETAWLIDRGLEVLGDEEYERKLSPITKDLTNQIYKIAFDGRSLSNECERGVVDTNRVWWVQAETIVGFLNGYEKNPERTDYLDAAKATWEFIKEYVLDKREGSEWFWRVSQDGKPDTEKPIVEPWKCPYHNGRMCFEVINRGHLL